jgi:hypothetical protein
VREFLAHALRDSTKTLVDASHVHLVKSHSEEMQESAEFKLAELTRFNSHTTPDHVELVNHAQEIWSLMMLELNASEEEFKSLLSGNSLPNLSDGILNGRVHSKQC